MPHDPVDYIFSLERLGMKFGLDKIAALSAALGNPHQTFRSIIIAGTNGKGSVTAMVERGLRAAGHRTARYTSPHLTRLEERFVIDGREASPHAVRAAADAVRSAIERLLDEGALDGPPTFFESVTAMAFVLFREADVGLAVLEVGLGGRLDATNIVMPMAAAITTIDFDHQEQLGNTLDAIAREKAGVIKPGIPVVCGPLPAEAEAIVRRVCDDVGARLVLASRHVDLESVLGGQELSLRGAHQRDNASVAVALLQQLDAGGIRVPPAAIRTALTDVDWPGRLEWFELGGSQVLLDAAHNPAGARALRRFLEQNGWAGSALVFGAMRDKDGAGILSELAPVCDVIVCTTADTPRAASPEDMAGIARRVAPSSRVEVVASARDALDRARSLRDRVVVAGSIFLIGPLRAILRQS